MRRDTSIGFVGRNLIYHYFLIHYLYARLWFLFYWFYINLISPKVIPWRSFWLCYSSRKGIGFGRSTVENHSMKTEVLTVFPPSVFADRSLVDVCVLCGTIKSYVVVTIIVVVGIFFSPMSVLVFALTSCVLIDVRIVSSATNTSKSGLQRLRSISFSLLYDEKNYKSSGEKHVTWTIDVVTKIGTSSSNRGRPKFSSTQLKKA